MNDYIRKAVELADGFLEFPPDCINSLELDESWDIDGAPTSLLDAIAVQLVRQSEFKPQYRDNPLDTIKEIIDNDWVK